MKFQGHDPVFADLDRELSVADSPGLDVADQIEIDQRVRAGRFELDRDGLVFFTGKARSGCRKIFVR